MATIKILNADTTWFKGPGWYVIPDEDEMEGPFNSRIDAELRDALSSSDTSANDINVQVLKKS